MSAARIVPALLLVIGITVLETAYGTGLGDLALFAGYQLVFLVLPGCLLFRALHPKPGGALRLIAIGWALGYVISILAFMLTAALGIRDAYLVYPVVVVLAALAIMRRRGISLRGTGDSVPSLPPRFGWGLVAVLLVVVGYFGVAYFSGTPLPGTTSFRYFTDYTWHIALAADAKHHWPVGDPHAAGAPEPYHYFVHLQMAAASQATGIDLPLIFFRLSPIPLVILVVLQLSAAGSAFLRNASVGLLAACLLLLVGDLQLNPGGSFYGHFPFLGLSFSLLFLSPSFLFGLIVFVPLMILIGERISSADERGRAGEWLVIVLFAVAAPAAKPTILPVTLMALVLYAGWSRYARGRIPPSIPLTAGLMVAVSGVVYLWQYRGHSSGLVLNPFETFSQMAAVISVKSYLLGALPGIPLKGAGLAVAGVLVGAVGLLGAQLVGLIWFFRRRGSSIPPELMWLAALLVGGVGSGLMMESPGALNQLFFVFVALVPGCLLAAEGLRLAWVSRPDLGERKRRLPVLALAFVILLAVLIAAPDALDLFSGANAIAHSLLFWYGGLAVLMVALYAAARRWLGPSRWPAAALCTAALVLVGCLSTPISWLAPAIDSPQAATTDASRLTPDLYRAMVWLRDETPDDATIAVNNSDLDQFNYSAFSEHRVYIEGWLFSIASVDAGFSKVLAGTLNPFAGRLAVDEAAFGHADPTALQTMRDDYSVRYLVIDSLSGFPADTDKLAGMFKTVYENSEVRILDMDASP